MSRNKITKTQARYMMEVLNKGNVYHTKKGEKGSKYTFLNIDSLEKFDTKSGYIFIEEEMSIPTDRDCKEYFFIQEQEEARERAKEHVSTLTDSDVETLYNFATAVSVKAIYSISNIIRPASTEDENTFMKNGRLYKTVGNKSALDIVKSGFTSPIFEDIIQNTIYYMLMSADKWEVSAEKMTSTKVKNTPVKHEVVTTDYKGKEHKFVYYTNEKKEIVTEYDSCIKFLDEVTTTKEIEVFDSENGLHKEVIEDKKSETFSNIFRSVANYLDRQNMNNPTSRSEYIDELNESTKDTQSEALTYYEACNLHGDKVAEEHPLKRSDLYKTTLKSIKDGDKEVCIALATLKKPSMQKVADECGLSKEAIRWALKRIKKALREEEEKTKKEQFNDNNGDYTLKQYIAWKEEKCPTKNNTFFNQIQSKTYTKANFKNLEKIGYCNKVITPIKTANGWK